MSPEAKNTHIPIKTSRFSKPQWETRSALDKNFRANASSKNPNTTLTVVIHPPDFGKAFNAFGNKAKSAKGKASAKPKPVIPTVSCIAPPSVVKLPASRDPKIGPVHEKETMAKVSAIKKIPMPPFILELESAVFPQLLGSVNS